MMDKAAKTTGYSELRDYQGKRIQAYLFYRDVFVCSPAGVGPKSITGDLLSKRRLEIEIK